MAISTDAAIEFFGTQDTLGTSSAAVSSTNFSIASDLSTFTNDDDAPQASVTLFVDYSVAPTASSSISLFLQLLNVQSTNDNDVPDANFQHVFVGAFPVNNVTTAQYITIDIALPNGKTSQEYVPFIQNNTGQTIPAGWDMFITPKTIGPHP